MYLCLRELVKWGLVLACLTMAFYSGYNMAEWRIRLNQEMHQMRCKTTQNVERIPARDSNSEPVCVERTISTGKVRIVQLVYKEI